MTRLPHLADAADIVAWADRITARSELPRLIRSIIKQTNDQVVTCEMRAAEGVGAPGYDGIVEATRGTPFVPEGRSVWEMGAGADYKAKAESDYATRTNDPLGEDTATTTFIFVTPRRWSTKDAWAAEKRAEGHWRDVRVFDVDSIESALE